VRKKSVLFQRLDLAHERRYSISFKKILHLEEIEVKDFDRNDFKVFRDNNHIHRTILLTAPNTTLSLPIDLI
jgi:hypothetical protein